MQLFVELGVSKVVGVEQEIEAEFIELCSPLNKLEHYFRTRNKLHNHGIVTGKLLVELNFALWLRWYF